MYYSPTYEHYIRVKIRCSTKDNNTGCDGQFEFEYPLTDLSPRVDSECEKCGRTVLIKLSSFDEEDIVSREPLSIEV